MRLKDLFIKKTKLSRVAEGQFIVKKMFIVVSTDRVDTKAMMPGMILAIELKFNDEISRVKLGLKEDEIVATLITNKGSLSEDHIKLIKQKRIEAVDVFIEKCSLNWFTVILNNESFFNLEKITLEEYNVIRKKHKEIGICYLPTY